MDAWDHFYDDPDLFRPDELHFNEVGSARLSQLLHAEVISYSKKFRRKEGIDVTEVA